MLWIKLVNTLREERIKISAILTTFLSYLIFKFMDINVGKNTKFFGYPMVYKHKNAKISIGSNGNFISNKITNLIGVNHRCYISALRDNSKIVIGNNCGFSGVTIGCAKSIYIGNNVIVGANVVITDTNWHNTNPLMRETPDPKPKEIRIDDNVFIGYGSIILKGVHIGKNTVIGAGSVVSESIPENVIARGNPCAVIKIL